MAGRFQGIIRVYLEDGSFRTIRIDEKTTVSNVILIMAKKMDCSAFLEHLSLHDVTMNQNGEESGVVLPSESIMRTVMDAWGTSRDQGMHMLMFKVLTDKERGRSTSSGVPLIEDEGKKPKTKTVGRFKRQLFKKFERLRTKSAPVQPDQGESAPVEEKTEIKPKKPLSGSEFMSMLNATEGFYAFSVEELKSELRKLDDLCNKAIVDGVTAIRESYREKKDPIREAMRIRLQLEGKRERR